MQLVDPGQEVSLLDGVLEVSDYVGAGAIFGGIRKFGKFAIRKVAEESAERAATRFVTGQLFERTIQTSKGPVGVLAEIVVEGDAITLQSVVIYATDQRQIKGVLPELLRATSQIKAELREQGFKTLRVIADRVPSSSSANPGKHIDFTYTLQK